MDVHGFCDPAFAAVQEAFEANFDRGLEVGASVCVTKQGVSVVDLWAGEAAQDGRPWQEDSIVTVFSTSKTMAAIPVLMLADRGEIDLHAPVARYWPEFAQNGKAEVRVCHVMSHSSALPDFDPPLESADGMYDWDAACDRLARQSPWWTPGTVSGYHGLTQGYLQGEIVRRVTGRSIGQFFREEVAGPLGADFHFGLPPEHDARVAELIQSIPLDEMLEQMAATAELDGISEEHRSVLDRVLAPPAFDTLAAAKTSAWNRAEIPSAGGIGNARSIARIHSALACGGTVDGVTLLSSAGVERILEEQTRGIDYVISMPIVWGMGFGINDVDSGVKAPNYGAPVSPNRRAFYWSGAGGSHTVVDLDEQISIGYAMNRLEFDSTRDLERAFAIIHAVWPSLAR